MDENRGMLRMLGEKEAKPFLERQKNSEDIDHFFHAGEEVTLKGSLFRIQAVTSKGLRLKILKRRGDEERE